MDGIIKMFEHKLNELNPRAAEITYDVSDLFKYLDSFNDICALVFDSRSGNYAPKDRNWLKDKVRVRALFIRCTVIYPLILL